MIRLGGPVFLDRASAPTVNESHGSGVLDPWLLVHKHREKGFRAAYAPNVRLDQGDLVRDIRRAFEAADIVIAEVGYWKNPLHLDAAQRQIYRKEMLESLALADELGACCMVCNLGSFVNDIVRRHSGRNFTMEAFEAAVATAQELLDAVKPRRAYLSFEMFPFNVNDSPEGVAALVLAVDRPRFAVHMDLVNLINCPRNYYSSGSIIRRCVELFGDRIVTAHAKDVLVEEPSISVILREVRPGLGGLDYGAYLRELHRLPQTVPLMMEHLPSEAEYDLAAAHIRAVAAKEGVAL